MTTEAFSEHPITLGARRVATPVGRVVRLVGLALFVAVVVAWASFLRPPFLGGPATYVIVAGRSMEPTLHGGDLALARPRHTYRRGDVIAYRIMKDQPGAGALVIHRIVGGSARDGFMTRGDNRSHRDPWRPKPADIAGKMDVHVPNLGMLAVFSHTMVGMALIAALVGLLVLCGGTRNRAAGDARRA